MNIEAYHKLLKEVTSSNATLVAVSKTKPVEDLEKLYQEGQRVFGENKVQELCGKAEVMPKDIEWHMIGHLQRNKVKYIAPFVSLIHGVDSERLFREIEKQAVKNERVISCLLQVHIAEEETKFGFSREELFAFLETTPDPAKVQICGLMGMATNTEDQTQVKKEFAALRKLFEELKSAFFSEQPEFKELSMGMSGDYPLALEEGSTMIRVGSLIFGARNYSQPA